MVKALVILGIIFIFFRLLGFFDSNNKEGLDSKLSMVYTLSNAEPIESSIRLPIPISTPKNRIISQSLSYEGWRIQKRNFKESSERGISFVAVEPKANSHIRLDYIFNTSSDSNALSYKSHNLKNTDQYLSFSHIDSEQLEQFLNLYPQFVSEALQVKGLEQLRGSISEFLNTDNAFAISSEFLCDDINGGYSLLLGVLRKQKLISRTVCGVALSHSKDSGIQMFFEVHSAGMWHVLDRDIQQVPVFIPLSRSLDKAIVYSSGLNVETSIVLDTVNLERAVSGDGSYNWLKLLNLRLLPIDVQEVLKVVLVLPFFILMVAFLRTVFELPMYGNLTPALLGMSLALNDFILILAIIASVMLPTFWVRTLSHSKNKILTHTATLTFLTMAIIFIMVLSDALGLLDSPSDALVPVVILVLLVDKYHASFNKNGSKKANVQLFYTLLFSVSVVPLVQFTPVGDILLTFPELHFFTLAITILLLKLSEDKGVKEALSNVS